MMGAKAALRVLAASRDVLFAFLGLALAALLLVAIVALPVSIGGAFAYIADRGPWHFGGLVAIGVSAGCTLVLSWALLRPTDNRDWVERIGWAAIALAVVGVAFVYGPRTRWYREAVGPTTDPRELKIGDLYLEQIKLHREMERLQSDLDACQARPRVNINYGGHR